MARAQGFALGLFIVFLLAVPAEGHAPGDDGAFQAIADEYETWVDFSFPEDALSHGRTEPTDRITEPGLRGATIRHNDLGMFMERLAGVDRESLSPAVRLDYDLLKREITHSLDSFQFKRWMMPIHQRGGPQQDLPQFAHSIPFRTRADWDEYAKRVTRLGAAVRDTRDMMVQALAEGLVPPKVVLEGVLGQFDAVQRGGLRELEAPMASMPATIPADEQARLRQLVHDSRLDALLALFELRTWLAEEYFPKALDSVSVSDQPMGADYYGFQLRHFTTTTLSAKAIHDTGLAEVARIRAEMMAVIGTTEWFSADPTRAALEPDARFASFVAFLRTDPRFYHSSAESLLSGYRDICKRIDAKLPEFFGVLPRQPYGVREIPRFMAPSQTTAYYQFGSMKAGLPGWFYANTYALDQRPRYEMVPLSLHEAVPGHHLQIAIADEVEGIRQFRRSVDSTAFVEGWALYAERLGIPMGLYDDPYDNFGRLLYEMWRACRLVVDTGMHAFAWPRAKAIDFMRTNTALSELNIEREIDRYIAWPGQATAYKIGELEIRRIRASCESRLGERFDLRAFHDHLLGAGPLPLDILAARMDAWCDARSTPAQ